MKTNDRLSHVFHFIFIFYNLVTKYIIFTISIDFDIIINRKKIYKH